MAVVADSLVAETRLTSVNGSINLLPEKVIGIMMSHVACVRDVVMASATCRKWREAARHYLHKLTFTETDIQPNNRSKMFRGVGESRISRIIFRMSWIQELSVCLDRSIELHAGAVIAWLLYAKKTLRSLTFKIETKPRVNILEHLGGADSQLERLEWSSAFIITFDPSALSFPYLVSLTLESTDDVIAGNIEALVTASPKLEFLLLWHVDVSSTTGTAMHLETMELKSLSLKSLQIIGGLGNFVRRIMLYTDHLESLTLSRGSFQQAKLVQGKGCGGLRHLSIDNGKISLLELGESLDSLHELEISEEYGYKTDWRGHCETYARASNLRKLCLRANTNICLKKDSIELDKIVLSFPHLHWLALDYEHASDVFELGRPCEFLILEKLIVLELFCFGGDGEFAMWIGRFLRRSPNLQRLRIGGALGRSPEDLNSFFSGFVQTMRLYPHIHLRVDVM